MKIVLVLMLLITQINVAHAVNIKDLQSQALRQVKYMDKYGFNFKVARKYVEICIHLKRYCAGGYDWCSSMTSEKKWMSISSENGLGPATHYYYNMTCGR